MMGITCHLSSPLSLEFPTTPTIFKAHLPRSLVSHAPHSPGGGQFPAPGFPAAHACLSSRIYHIALQRTHLFVCLTYKCASFIFTSYAPILLITAVVTARMLQLNE